MNETANVPAIILVFIVAGSVTSLLIAEDYWKRRQDEARLRQYPAHEPKVEEDSTSPYSATALRKRRQHLKDTHAEEARIRAIIVEREQEERRLRHIAEARQHVCRQVGEALAGVADEIPKLMAAAAEREWNRHSVPLVTVETVRSWRFHAKQGEEGSEPVERLVRIAASESAEYRRLIDVCNELGYEVTFSEHSLGRSGVKWVSLEVSF